MDNLNTLDNVSKNTHTKLFKSQFSEASGNNQRALPVADAFPILISYKRKPLSSEHSVHWRDVFFGLFFVSVILLFFVIYTVTSSLFVAALFSLSCLSTSATWSLSSLRKRITIR